MSSPKASKPLKIFFHAVDGIGHLNACVGIAQALVNRGHRVFFLLNSAFAGQFAKYGFEEILLVKPPPPVDPTADPNAKPENPIKAMAAMLITGQFLSAKSPIEKMNDQLASDVDIFKDLMGNMVEINEQIEKAIEKEKPDLFVIDSFVIPPAVPQAPLPWMFLCSAQPLCVFRSEGKLPPYGAGFPIDSAPSTWEEYIPIWKKYKYERFAGRQQDELNAHFSYTPPYAITDDITLFPNSPYLNIYGYPEELDYSDVFPLPANFARVDAFIRDIPEPFELPKEIAEKPGEKLIYVSLGSMGSVDVELMKRITRILAKTPHKYIVSKGPLADEYELPENCWGESFLPQTRILPLVDLVITHGGNNTVTETFSFGKPMIVLPLFGDQLDSAQRVAEKGFGVRLEPYSFTEEQLLGALDKLLNDKELATKLKVASERMQASKSKQIVCERIEKEVAKYKAEH